MIGEETTKVIPFKKMGIPRRCKFKICMQPQPLLLLVSILHSRPPSSSCMRCSFCGWFSVPLLTRSRPVLRWLHIASLVWGILTEVLPWPCPLTLLENWLEGRAGVEPYQGGFLLHYLDKLVYPDISANVLTIAGVIVCVANLAFYARQVWISRRAHR